jgi:long-subunit fatty acid transport protein
MPSAAAASQLLVPAIGVPDSALAGATVASPLTPTAAAFSNPAGLVGLEDGAMSAAFGLPVGHSRVHASAPPGYDTTSDFVAYAPEGGSVFAAESGLRYGFALYGSLGSSFDSDADPSVGVDHDFYAAAAVTNLALMAAYPVTDRLSVGAGLALVYGQSHLRYFQTIPFAYTVRGAGVQANVGLTYAVSDRVRVGVSFRTPGMVWMNGDDRLPTGAKQDVELDLDLPAQIFVGLNADVTDRLHVGLCGRWTDSSTFSDSNFHFDATPAADVPYIGGATDEWRIAAGTSYALTETVTVAGGFSYADSIVPDSFVSPLLVDTGEWKITAGLAWEMPGFLSGWTLDAVVGESPTEARNISASEAVIFPGRYNIGGQIYLIGIRTTL